MDQPESLLRRWWTYQCERFPPTSHGLLIAVFTASAIGYSQMLSGAANLPSIFSMVAAFVSCLGFFMLLRIADEFKDYDDDCRYRPYRAVPRGLVSLSGLRNVAIAVIVVQIGLALLTELNLLSWYLITLGYLFLMSKEFFTHRWLKAHPLVYLFSHMIIMPLIALYATAHQWLPHQPPALTAYLALSFFAGIVLEIGRKIRAQEMEEDGVETYTALWGQRTATLAWLAALLLSALAAIFAASMIDNPSPGLAISAVFLLVGTINALLFLKSPNIASARRFELISGLWLLGVYLSVGILPLVLSNV